MLPMMLPVSMIILPSSSRTATPMRSASGSVPMTTLKSDSSASLMPRVRAL